MHNSILCNLLRNSITILKKVKHKIFCIKQPEATPYVYNIENFNYENYILNIGGWIFNKDKKINNISLILINGDQEYEICTINDFKKRLDVYNVFKNENSMYSGFAFKIRIENVNSISIYFEIDNEEKILIKELKNSFTDKVKQYKKKLTIQNMKKAMILLKKHEVSKLKRSMQKIDVEVIDDNIKNINFVEFENKISVNLIEYPKILYDNTIDIIIPVYNGYEYLQNLFTTIAKTKMSYRLIIINDSSTDKRVKEFLSKYKNSDEIILIENEVNLGFVKTVNKAFNMTKNNIALLNTDIELPEMWLERLMMPIILNSDVASSTPFTNCGTVCSFPEFFKDNEIFEKMDLDAIDEAFKSIQPSYTRIPTGVGFCMGIKKDALDKIGLFDSDTFEKGYGEENDWCQRAVKAGYKNVQVENLYVYHKHGGSFLTEEKKKLIKLNSKLLEKKHPNFNLDVIEFCNADPVKDIRTYIIFKLLSSICEDINLYFNHNIGGGATMYLQKRINEIISISDSNMVVSYDVIGKKYLFDFKYKNYNISYDFTKIDDIIGILHKLRIKNIYINELVTYPNLYYLLEKLMELKYKKNIKIIMLLHDFYSICPTINLMNYKGCYCGIPSIDKCEKCIRKNELNTYYNYESMMKWRSEWGNFLNRCDNIMVFSESSKSILQKCYETLSNITIKPHFVDYIGPIKKEYKSTESLNIGLLGTLNYNKGLDLIKKILGRIEKLQINVNIILIGSSVEKIKHKNFRQTGEYTTDMIGKLVIENDIDLFFIASIWPETFSYTTQEIINMEFPIVSLDIGAQAEKIKLYNRGLILKSLDEKEILNEIINFSSKFKYKKE